MPVIGILGGQSPETYEPFLVPFRQGLSEVGFVEGNNVAIESRWAQGRYDRLPDLADVLVSRRVTLIYAIGGTEVALAAKGATQKIPSVFTIGGDPVKAGVVASLNRPGGNVTGTSFFTVGLGTKRLELLYELVPRVSVIAVLVQYETQAGRTEAPTARSPVAGTVDAVKPLHGQWSSSDEPRVSR